MKAVLFHTNLQEANLQHAQLVGADMGKAHLGEAKLDHADLRGVVMTSVQGLTQEQINKACVDEQSLLPRGLQHPVPCHVENR